VVAFAASVIVTVALVLVAMRVISRRPKGTPMTWGEAFVGATFIWALFLLTYAIVPHQFITMCDKDFGWRSDTFGIPTGPFYTWPIINGRLVNQQTIRDIIVSNIYVVGLVAHVMLWGWANRRGDKGAEVVPVSPYGRPLVRKA
jgi:hypothetical protein